MAGFDLQQAGSVKRRCLLGGDSNWIDLDLTSLFCPSTLHLGRKAKVCQYACPFE